MPIDLSGRTALVTGGGRGLGRAISLVLAEAGANVVVGYLRRPAPASDVVASIEAAGGEALALQGDVSHVEDVDRIVAEVEQRFGGAEIFVSNAALGVFAEPADLRQRAVDRTLQIGAWPLLDVSRRLFPWFEQRGFGRIVSISSIGARRAIPRYAALAMAKGAGDALVRNLAAYVGATFSNVTANTVVPVGFDDQALPAELAADADRWKAEAERRAPGGRLPTTREVAGAVLFLVSDLAAGINGTDLVVDRGWSIG